MRTLTEEELETVNGDVIDQIRDCHEEGVECRAIEATAKELAELKIGTLCGSGGNEAFKLVAQRFPDLLVRCGLEVEENIVRCCDIMVMNDAQGELVEELVEQAKGSLRYDSIDPDTGWAYFENE
jgi:hypothetical protein